MIVYNAFYNNRYLAPLSDTTSISVSDKLFITRCTIFRKRDA